MKDNIVLRWNNALLQAVRATTSKPPVVARAIAMVHTAMYDAWAHYDNRAKPVRIKTIRRVPSLNRTDENRQKALSYAALRVLCDLFPSQNPLFEGLMHEYAYDVNDTRLYDVKTPPLDTDLSPALIGNTSADFVLKFHKNDGSNQKGNYEDLSREYKPINDPEPAKVKDINHWQPQLDKKTNTVQPFLYPHWGWVVPFAFNPKTDLKEVKPPVQYPCPLPLSNEADEETLTVEQKKAAADFETNCTQVVNYSRNLGDTEKAIAEYWADGPGSETPPGHWCLLARYISLRDCHSLNEDVKLFFALGNAVHDAGIACWRLKREQDYCRPYSAIHTLFDEEEMFFWGGPYQGTVCKPANKWASYLPTPAFAEFPSGHSTFSSAAATILWRFKGSDYFGMAVTIQAGSSKIEGGLTPTHNIKLSWQHFSEAAEQAGKSRLYGGIHFPSANTEGLRLGRKLGDLVWLKTQAFIECRDPNNEEDNC